MVLRYIQPLLRIDVNLPATCDFNMIRQHAVDVRVREIIRNYRNYTANGTQRIRTRRGLKTAVCAVNSGCSCCPEKNCSADLIDCETGPCERCAELRRRNNSLQLPRHRLGRELLPFCFFSPAGFHHCLYVRYVGLPRFNRMLLLLFMVRFIANHLMS